jgi:Zn-finger protein
MNKCEICSEKLSITFLNKQVGTVIKDEKGKKHWICQSCQKGKSKEEMLNEL